MDLWHWHYDAENPALLLQEKLRLGAELFNYFISKWEKIVPVLPRVKIAFQGRGGAGRGVQSTDHEVTLQIQI